MFPNPPPASPPLPTSPTTTQSQTAAGARALLHALLVAGMEPTPILRDPTSISTSTATSSTSAAPTSPSSSSSTTTTTTRPTPNTRPPPPEKAKAGPSTGQKQQPQRQTLILDGTYRLTGQGDNVTLPSTPPRQPFFSHQLILSALASGANVEVRTGVCVVWRKEADDRSEGLKEEAGAAGADADADSVAASCEGQGVRKRKVEDVEAGDGGQGREGKWMKMERKE